MRKLTKRFEYLPASENNQQTKLARAMSKLAAAEEELEAGTHATDAKAGPLNAMGSQRGMMRGRTGAAAFAGSMARMGSLETPAGGGGNAGGVMGPNSIGMGAGTGRATGAGAGAADNVAKKAAERRRARQLIAGSIVELAIHDKNPRSKAILDKLEEVISMSFNDAAPLVDVLKYIKAATTTKTYAGMPIYVDPKGLEEADASMTKTIQVDLEGVTLRTTLRLLLKQLGLAYCVRDGLLIISSEEGIAEEVEEAKKELEAAGSLKPAGRLQ